MNNKKITDYTVFEARDLDDLVDEVTELIGTGWQPYGDLLITKNEDYEPGSYNQGFPNWYTQAMVKYED